nr:unnamed protein product [Callosobruchus chinensis]
MAFTDVAVLLFLWCGASAMAEVSADSINRINVSVYYESLCMDSAEFLTTQLHRAYLIHGDKINVDLVPFGKAKANNDTGRWNFTCQHGPRECYGNKVQACAVALLDQRKSTEFVVCIMKSSDAVAEENLYKCATENNITFTEIKHCAESSKGDELLAFNGYRTTSVKPPIRFVPTIIFNDSYNQSMQDMALHNFSSVVDFLINQNCDNCKSGQSNFISSVTCILVMFGVLQMFEF